MTTAAPHHHPKTRRPSGFTLLELLVASALGAIMLGLLFNVLAGVLDSWNTTTAREECYREVRAALQIMSRDMDNLVKVQPDAPPVVVDISVNAVADPSGKVVGFFSKIPASAQVPGQNYSDISAVVYFLAPSPSSPFTSPALFRRLLSSNEVFTRLQSPDGVFSVACDPSLPGTEVVAQNVTHFQISLLDASFKPLPQPPAADQAKPAHLDLELEVLPSRPSQEYFLPSTSEERRQQLRLKEARQFSLRHHL